MNEIIRCHLAQKGQSLHYLDFRDDKCVGGGPEHGLVYFGLLLARKPHTGQPIKLMDPHHRSPRKQAFELELWPVERIEMLEQAA